MTKDLTNFIAMARWVAAFAVLVGHAGVIINISDIMVGPHGPGVYAWWFLAAFSHQAVLVFFVISGFLVGGPLLRDRARETPFLHEYFVDRFSRIYIVMVPALLWTFAIDSVGRAAFPATGVYDAPFFASVFAPIQYLWTLLQQQHLWAAQAGTNGPLWSLACEMWYYITFPLLLLPLSRAYSKPWRMGGLALGAALVAFLATPEIMAAFGVDVGARGLMPMMNNGVGMFLFGYGVWALGALARVAPRPAVKSVWIALVLFLAALAVDAACGARAGPGGASLAIGFGRFLGRRELRAAAAGAAPCAGRRGLLAPRADPLAALGFLLLALRDACAARLLRLGGGRRAFRARVVQGAPDARRIGSRLRAHRRGGRLRLRLLARHRGAHQGAARCAARTAVSAGRGAQAAAVRALD